MLTHQRCPSEVVLPIEEATSAIQATLNAMTSQVAIMDPAGRIIAVNGAWRRFADLNGLKRRGYCVGMSYLAICEACDPEVVPEAQVVATALRDIIGHRRSEFRIDYACHSRRCDRWFQVRLMRGADSARSLIIAKHTDVTDVRRAEQALSETEERLRLANRAAGIGAFDVDLNTKHITWSPEPLETFGVDPGSNWTTEFWAKCLHPDDRERVRMRVQAALESGKGFDVEHRVVHSDGRVRWVRGLGRVVRDGEGKALRLIGVYLDTTDRKESEERLRAHHERLEALVAERTEALRQASQRLHDSERLATVGTLSAGIAHEISSPLTSILLTAQVAQKSKDSRQVAEALEDIIAEATRGGRIIRGMLTLARQHESPKAPTNLNDLVRRAVNLTRSYVGSERLSIEQHLTDPMSAAMLNELEVEQLIVNILKNAADVSPQGVHVSVRTACATGFVQLIISDNGPGIPATDLKHVFDPFFTTRRATGGTGLGLSLCHAIVAEHRGTITVESPPGCGATFTIQFPEAHEAARPLTVGNG